ncbi:MAG: FAD binding domain-containing protein [Streptosporangiaceae bacterium]
MKPPPFAYEAPEALAEAVDLLTRWGDEAKLLAGGQSLMPLLAFRLARPEILVDLNRVRELEYADLGTDRLVLGSLTRHRTIEHAPVPDAISEAVGHIGHVAIRNRGTVGGSLAHADPSAEWAAVALAYDGVIVARSSAGERRIPAGEFFVGFLTSDLRPTEVIVRLELRMPEGPAGSAFVEYARRHGDFALGGVAAVLGLTPDGEVRHVRLAVIGAATRPTRCHAAERVLLGRAFDDAGVLDAAGVLAGELEPSGAGADERRFRLQVAKTLARRALTVAAGRAANGVSLDAG